MKQVIVTEGQSLLDISIQEYGDSSLVLKIARDNNLSNGVDEILESGTYLNIDETAIKDKDIAEYFGKRTMRINTSNATTAGDYNNDFNNDFNI